MDRSLLCCTGRSG